MAYVETGDGIADDTVVLRQLKGSPLNIGEFDSGLRVIVDALNDLDERVMSALSSGLPRTTGTLVGTVLTLDNEGSQNCVVDTEGRASADSLTRIVGLGETLTILIQARNSARVITVTHGTYLRLLNGSNFVLNNVWDSIFLRVGSDGICGEISRSSNQ